MNLEFQNATCFTCVFYKEANEDAVKYREGDCKRYPPIFKGLRGFSREEYVKVKRINPACGEYREDTFSSRKEEI